MKNRVWNIVLLLCIPFVSLAQEFEKTPEGLKSFIKDLYEVKVSKMKEMKDIQSVQSSLDDVFSGSEVNVDLDGNVEIRRLNRNFILKRIENYFMYEKLEVEYRVAQFHSARVAGNSGVIEFKLNYFLKEDGEEVSQGSTLMNVIAKYYGNTWKLTYISDFGMDERKTKGDCFCQIYSKGKEKFFATILYPDGDQYTEDLFNIKITVPFDFSAIPFPIPTDIILSRKEPLKKFTFNQEDAYHWYDQTGAIYKDKEQIGEATNPNKVVRSVLLYMYKNHCRTLKLKKMR